MATATSGLPVVLTIDDASTTVCKIGNGFVSFIGAGTCTIDANQGGGISGGMNYKPAPQVQQSFVVEDSGGMTPQTITFTSSPPVNAMVGDPAYLVSATATSALPVVLTIDDASIAVCTISNDFVSFIGSGTCTIDANQGGGPNGGVNYQPAPQVQQSFEVTSSGDAPTVTCVLPKQIGVVDETYSLDLSLLFAPPPGQPSLVFTGTSLPPQLSIIGSLLTGTFGTSGTFTSTLTATVSAPGGASASENVVFQVLPADDILLRDGFDPVGSGDLPCQ
jgi:hypothetical protein